jgi:hypothetical protein
VICLQAAEKAIKILEKDECLCGVEYDREGPSPMACNRCRAISVLSSSLKDLKAVETVVMAARAYAKMREYQNVEACRKDQDRLADNLENAVSALDAIPPM